MIASEYGVLQLQLIQEPIHFLEKARLIQRLELISEALLISFEKLFDNVSR